MGSDTPGMKHHVHFASDRNLGKDVVVPSRFTQKGRTFAMTEGEELTQHKSARRDRALRVHRFVRHRLVQMNSNKAKD